MGKFDFGIVFAVKNSENNKRLIIFYRENDVNEMGMQRDG